ncbi:hypothetical protein GCM10028793_53220 [Nocardiopsis oceani]
MVVEYLGAREWGANIHPAGIKSHSISDFKHKVSDRERPGRRCDKAVLRRANPGTGRKDCPDIPHPETDANAAPSDDLMRAPK